MSLPRRNQVARADLPVPFDRALRDAQIRKLAPGTIRTLSIELTPARAAALDVFEITTGTSVQQLFLDWFDDEIASVLVGKGRA